uniref:Uncharacterized protein n=1 Tax=Arundo donax TaxID=35708 RepID=A0A0A9C276_ARUDO
MQHTVKLNQFCQENRCSSATEQPKSRLSPVRALLKIWTAIRCAKSVMTHTGVASLYLVVIVLPVLHVQGGLQKRKTRPAQSAEG